MQSVRSGKRPCNVRSGKRPCNVLDRFYIYMYNITFCVHCTVVSVKNVACLLDRIRDEAWTNTCTTELHANPSIYRYKSLNTHSWLLRGVSYGKLCKGLSVCVICGYFLYRPPTKLREGNVFNRVCPSVSQSFCQPVCSQGIGVCSSYCWQAGG